jgi:hypothetical protein
MQIEMACLALLAECAIGHQKCGSFMVMSGQRLIWLAILQGFMRRVVRRFSQ